VLRGNGEPFAYAKSLLSFDPPLVVMPNVTVAGGTDAVGVAEAVGAGVAVAVGVQVAVGLGQSVEQAVPVRVKMLSAATVTLKLPAVTGTLPPLAALSVDVVW